MKPRTLLIYSRSKRQKLNVSGYFANAPLGIAMLAASLDRAGYPVELFDSNAFPDGDRLLEQFLGENKFDHVGISSHYFSAEHALEIAGVVKKNHPETVVSLGGPMGLLNPARIAEYTDALDVIAHGEGEETIIDIVRAVEKGDAPKNIAGTTYVGGGEILKGPQRKSSDMDSLPRPLLDKLPLSRYRLHPPFGVYPPGLYIESARGCPHRCTFCTLPREIRMRSADKVVADVENLVARFGVREVHFVDPTFTFDRERVIEICRKTRSLKNKPHWTCKTRCDMVDGELLGEMAKAGCYTISYGVETASQPILDFYNKDIKVEQIEQSLAETKKAGIRVLAYMLIGSPGETDESVRRTMDMVRRYKPDFALYAQMLPDPGSIRVREEEKKGVYSEKQMLDYYLAGKTDLLDEKGVSGLPAKRIEQWIAMAFNDFYARPGYIVRRILDIRSIHDVLNYFRGVWVLFADKLGFTKTVG